MVATIDIRKKGATPSETQLFADVDVLQVMKL